MTKGKNALLLGLVVILIGGCASHQVSVAPEFWQQTDGKIAIVLHKIPEQGALYQEGQQGLLDIAIAGAVSEVGAHARSLDADRFREITEVFQRELGNAGFETVVYPEEIDLEELPNFRGSKGSFRQDLGEVFESTGCDKIILLQLMGYGITREYYAFVALSGPRAVSIARGVMIDKEDNQILWDSGRTEAQIREPVIGQWKQSPDYPNLTDAIYRAIEKSKMQLAENFFTKRTSRQTIDTWMTTLENLGDPNTPISPIERYLWRMELISPFSFSCKKPYRLTQDCSDWTGAKRKISIEGKEVKISGSEDGKVVRVMAATSVFSGKFADATTEALETVVEFLEKNEIGILDLKGVTISAKDKKVSSYLLELDQDGYSLLREFTIE